MGRGDRVTGGRGNEGNLELGTDHSRDPQSASRRIGKTKQATSDRVAHGVRKFATFEPRSAALFGDIAHQLFDEERIAVGGAMELRPRATDPRGAR